MKNRELLDLITNKINPPLELFTEITNVISKDGLITINKQDIEGAFKNTNEYYYQMSKKIRKDAELSAINNLCNNCDFNNAKYFLVVIRHNGDLTLAKLQEIMNLICKYTHSYTQIIIGDYIADIQENNTQITSFVLK